MAGLAVASGWRPDGARFRLLAGIMLVLFGAYALAFLAISAFRMGSRPAGDFFGLWSCAKFVLDHPAVQVYDPARLHTAQVALGMDPRSNYPFPYPPSFLLALWPLGLLPWLVAYPVAIGFSLILFVWATVGVRWRSPGALGALLAPTTTITIVAGQAGFLAAALLVGGFRLAVTRPIVAGVLLGLLTYKPQMGLLVPLALISAGLWRTIVAACATVAALVTVTSIAFGWTIWPVWASSMIQYAGLFAAESSKIVHLMPTVLVSLERLGAPPSIAVITQVGTAAVVAWVVWRCFRHGPTPLATAALLVATFLVTPHAFVYDMPILATAVIWFVAERRQAGAAFSTGEVLLMMLAMIAPITLVAGGSRFPLTLLTLALLFGAIVRREHVRSRQH